MLVRLAYMVFLAGGALWLWAAELSDSSTWMVGFGAVWIVLYGTGMFSCCSCRQSGVCRTPSIGCALFFACVGIGLAAWSIAHGGSTTIAANWDVNSWGRIIAWPVIIVLAPFANDFLMWKSGHGAIAKDEPQRTWERADWKGG